MRIAVCTVGGAGTIGLELSRLPQRLDVLLVALGNGAMFNGIAHVMKARSQGTRMIAVGSAGASAMVDSWRAGRLIEHAHVSTIADGIATRTPIPEALDDMQGLADEVLLVSDDDILRGMKLLHRHTGIIAKPTDQLLRAPPLPKNHRQREWVHCPGFPGEQSAKSAVLAVSRQAIEK